MISEGMIVALALASGTHALAPVETTTLNVKGSSNDDGPAWSGEIAMKRPMAVGTASSGTRVSR
jgi:hypothetical protein